MKYKVIGYDPFDHTEFPVGEYKTKEEAIQTANSKCGQMTLMYVHDKNGKVIHRSGTY